MKQSLKGFQICHCMDESGDFAVTFSVCGVGGFGFTELSVLDFIRKEKIQCIEKAPCQASHFVSKKSGFSDFSFAQKYGSVKIEVAETVSYTAVFSKCFPHTEMKAEIKLTPVFQCEREFFKVSGFLETKGRRYEFSMDSTAILTSSQKVADYGNSGAFWTENKGVSFENKKPFSVEKPKTASEPRRVKGEHTNLVFTPFFNDRLDVTLPLFTLHGSRLFGTYSGEMNGETVEKAYGFLTDFS